MNQQVLKFTEFTWTEFARDDDGYPAGFFHWLSKNQKIYNRFVVHSLTMAMSRKHYSAYTIINLIRWETDLRDADKTFKINNNWTPGMARLFMAEYPKHRGFFRCRDSQGMDL